MTTYAAAPLVRSAATTTVQQSVPQVVQPATVVPPATTVQHQPTTTNVQHQPATTAVQNQPVSTAQGHFENAQIVTYMTGDDEANQLAHRRELLKHALVMGEVELKKTHASVAACKVNISQHTADVYHPHHPLHQVRLT